MNYVVHKRFKGRAICGDVNLAALTKCVMENGMITLNGRELCVATSENAHNFFARDDDGCGMERGALTQRIIKRLSKKDEHHQDRWDLIWDDPVSQKYRREEHEDYWIWNHSFYNAPVQDLLHIASLVGA